MSAEPRAMEQSTEPKTSRLPPRSPCSIGELGDAFDADVAGELDEVGVDRPPHRLVETDLPGVAAPVVRRRPVVVRAAAARDELTGRRVVHERGVAVDVVRVRVAALTAVGGAAAPVGPRVLDRDAVEPVLERRRRDERLERRPRLTPGSTAPRDGGVGRGQRAGLLLVRVALPVGLRAERERADGTAWRARRLINEPIGSSAGSVSCSRMAVSAAAVSARSRVVSIRRPPSNSASMRSLALSPMASCSPGWSAASAS